VESCYAWNCFLTPSVKAVRDIPELAWFAEPDHDAKTRIERLLETEIVKIDRDSRELKRSFLDELRKELSAGQLKQFDLLIDKPFLNSSIRQGTFSQDLAIWIWSLESARKSESSEPVSEKKYSGFRMGPYYLFNIDPSLTFHTQLNVASASGFATVWRSGCSSAEPNGTWDSFLQSDYTTSDFRNSISMRSKTVSPSSNSNPPLAPASNIRGPGEGPALGSGQCKTDEVPRGIDTTPGIVRRSRIEWGSRCVESCGPSNHNTRTRLPSCRSLAWPGIYCVAFENLEKRQLKLTLVFSSPP